ncbi:transforming growth factor beta-1-induced transcript 1 protein-like isoform X2 [Patagioenas fasciata]|uniref:transforming growth factor beta-1-induced transcript 1 protein-like isoform X2 n=1 Tax=Patagioenas fasciata TaxID=372321 RepID=UPI003A992951
MEDLDALLADLEMTSRLACPPSPPGGDIPPPRPPLPYGHVPGEDTEQLYSSVWRPRPPRAPPTLGQLERLLQDLDGTQGGPAAELEHHVPPTKTPELPPPPKSGAQNLGAPSTSATEELDRLMASLADFNLHPPPPQKMGVPSGGNLEELLVTLEQDLANRGVPTQDKGVCGGCRRPIVGKALVALGRPWHPEHLVCGHCGEALGESPFLERGGVPYCPPDYGRLFAPKCAQCHQPILQGSWSRTAVPSVPATSRSCSPRAARAARVPSSPSSWPPWGNCGTRGALSARYAPPPSPAAPSSRTTGAPSASGTAACPRCPQCRVPGSPRLNVHNKTPQSDGI